MAVAYVQRVVSFANATAATSRAVTLAASTTAGNKAIAVVKNSAGKTVSSATDSRGNTWTVDKVSANTTGASVSILSAPITTALLSGDTITLNFTGSADCAAAVYEYSGLATAAPDVSNQNTSNGASATSGSTSVTTTNANDLVIAGVGVGSNETSVTPPTGFTLRDSGQISTLTVQMAEDVVSATGTYTTNWSWSAISTSWSVAAVAYKASAAAAVASLAPENRLVRRNSLLRR